MSLFKRKIKRELTIRIMEGELMSLHNLYIAAQNCKDKEGADRIMEEIHEINKHLLTVSKLSFGLEY
jgi:hypothetical protein